MHFEKSSLHALHFGFPLIESYLETLRGFVVSTGLRLFDGLHLTHRLLFLFKLLSAQLVNHGRQVSNLLLAGYRLRFSAFHLFLVHVQLSHVLLGLPNGTHCPSLLLRQHSTQLACFSHSPLLFLFQELLQ